MASVNYCADCGRFAYQTSGGWRIDHHDDCGADSPDDRAARLTVQLAQAREQLTDAYVTIGCLRERLSWFEHALRDLPVPATPVPSRRRRLWCGAGLHD